MSRGKAVPFWDQVREGERGCWQWAGSFQSAGYGTYGALGRLAHRLAYEEMVAPVPALLVLDHLCGNRGCVNPGHLDPIPRSLNSVRGRRVKHRRLA